MKCIRTDHRSDEEIVARRTAITEAMVTEALRDEDYRAALFIAAFNVMGFSSVMQSVPLDVLMERARKIALSARRHAAGKVLQ